MAIPETHYCQKNIINILPKTNGPTLKVLWDAMPDCKGYKKLETKEQDLCFKWKRTVTIHFNKILDQKVMAVIAAVTVNTVNKFTDKKLVSK